MKKEKTPDNKTIKKETQKDKREEKREKIYRGITHINDDIVEEAEGAIPAKASSGGRRLWQMGGLAAACLCLLVLGSALLLPRLQRNGADGGGIEPRASLAENTGSSQAVGNDNINGEGLSGDPDPSSAIPILPITLAEMSSRPTLLSPGTDGGSTDIAVPGSAPYTIEPDLSNVIILDQFSWIQDNTEAQALLSQNGFYVGEAYGNEFFEIYEDNRYTPFPSFVTVDSLMHTYHLYFSHLLRSTEQTYLSDSILRLSHLMRDASAAQYEQLAGTEWEEAAKRNVAFFTVGARLLDDVAPVEDYVADIVQCELDRIDSADSIQSSSITGSFEDYTQYIPRGYYEGDVELERYFRAMMWYGRTHFVQDDESLDRSALLMTMALSADSEAYRIWEAIYAVTSFFAGASDDCGAGEYAPLICAAYGENASLADLPGNTSAFDAFHAMTGTLPAPAVNSIPIMDGEDNVIPGFRFMGQRFTIDATVMQNLIYSKVRENSAGEKRMLPDVLDVAAALGSDTALALLEENGATDYKGYSENMAMLREGLSRENEAIWSASLYSGWLNTLRPLLEAKGDGYPVFMQNAEWTKKNLECFSGSFAELKHDTILYTKQAVAEMGGDYDENVDDRGYVEPEPLVYSRFADLARLTAQGLKRYGILTPKEEENLSRLAQMAETMLVISNKELRDQTLTDEEYDFIRGYGGSIEHFWSESIADAGDGEWIYTQECPAPIVADIATDPDSGQVLEVATGRPSAGHGNW